MNRGRVIVLGTVLFVLLVLMVCGVVGPLVGLLLMACALGVFGSDSQTPAKPQESSSSPVLDTLAVVGMLSLIDDDDEHHHSFDDHHDYADDGYDDWDD